MVCLLEPSMKTKGKIIYFIGAQIWVRNFKGCLMLNDFTSKCNSAATFSYIRLRMINRCAGTCPLRDSILKKGKIKNLIRTTFNNSVTCFPNYKNKRYSG